MKRSETVRGWVLMAGLLMGQGLQALAHAADFPEKAVRFIVPFPPGGGTDALARILGGKLSEYWGQQVIVDNRGGAQGGVGTAQGAKMAPDGYTIILGHSGALVINPHMYSNPGYDTLKDFTPISLGTEMPYILVVHPSMPVTTMKEAGFNDFGEAREWYGIVAPAGVPAAIVTCLNSAIVHALKEGDVQKRLQPLAQKAVSSSPAEFSDYIRTQYGLWGKVVKVTGAKAN